MKNKTYKEVLKEIDKNQKLLAFCENEITRLPPGKLIRQTKNGKFYFFLSYKNKGITKRKYLRKTVENKSLINNLIIKEGLGFISSFSKNNIEILEKYSKFYVPLNPNLWHRIFDDGGNVFNMSYRKTKAFYMNYMM